MVSCEDCDISAYTYHWLLHQINVKNAFPHESLYEEVYIEHWFQISADSDIYHKCVGFWGTWYDIGADIANMTDISSIDGRYWRYWYQNSLVNTNTNTEIWNHEQCLGSQAKYADWRSHRIVWSNLHEHNLKSLGTSIWEAEVLQWLFCLIPSSAGWKDFVNGLC